MPEHCGRKHTVLPAFVTAARRMTVIYTMLLQMIPDMFRISAVRKRCISVALCPKADTMKLKEHRQDRNYGPVTEKMNDHRLLITLFLI